MVSERKREVCSMIWVEVVMVDIAAAAVVVVGMSCE